MIKLTYSQSQRLIEAAKSPRLDRPNTIDKVIEQIKRENPRAFRPEAL